MLTAEWKLIFLGLAFALTAIVSYNKGEAASDKVHEKAMAEHVLEDQRNARTAEAAQREREQSFNVVREEQEKLQSARMAAVLTERDNLARDADSLRGALAGTESRLRKASQLARDAGVHEGTIQTALVLTKLFGEATEELQRVAGTADEWYVKATQCTAFYDEIRSR
ncbi:hypothetical protein [Pseudomonas phage 98PfluR60PP]|uniref:Uncharacterized protein n=1 Tax=Pseudomonas phage 98PfluR60PP TaxID=2163965 RepID=A0A2S1PFW1_9CAUD|nr:Rz-like spanin [Pseudomonas phage 98PfluR60PP]AWH15454.1 hypothetical protein [Pseudomonas phage 98PfluR60PP]